MEKELSKIKVGEHVGFANSIYEIAEFKEFPHGVMIGIYDEGNKEHIDYLNPSSLKYIDYFPCPHCQNGCPACGGSGQWFNLIDISTKE